jgi:arginase
VFKKCVQHFLNTFRDWDGLVLAGFLGDNQHMNNQFILTPYFLGEHSLELEALAQPGWRLNKPLATGNTLQERLSVRHQAIADFAAGAIGRGERPISIAGDCCTTIGMLAGLQRAGLNPVVVWLDAHGDFNTWQTSPQGFLGGMPLAMLVGRGEQTMVEAVGIRLVAEERVILSDARDLDPAEEQALAASDVHHLSDPRDLLTHPLLGEPFYLHFDMDLVNPNDAPAMSYRTPGGPSAAELRSIFRALAQTGRVAAVSVATWNPELDGNGQSRKVCMDLLQTLIEN